MNRAIRPLLLLPSLLAALALGGCGESKGDRICRQGCGCKDNGRCIAKNGRCVAGSDADCKASRGCQVMALCAARDGACVTSSDEDCKQSELCKRSGVCTFRSEGEHGRCVR